MPDAAVAPEQQQEVGVVLGRVLVHALQGRCFSAHFLPEESFFLDSIMDRVGSENLTVEGKDGPNRTSTGLLLALMTERFCCRSAGLEAVMMMLNIGPGEDHEHALRTNDHHHHHEEQRGRSKRSTGRHEDNSTWEQVRTSRTGQDRRLDLLSCSSFPSSAASLLKNCSRSMGCLAPPTPGWAGLKWFGSVRL